MNEKIMEDKEVGKLWERCYHDDITHDTMTDNLFTIKCLIRKLVEERARGDYYRAGHLLAFERAPIESRDLWIRGALGKFAIPPESWKP